MYTKRNNDLIDKLERLYRELDESEWVIDQATKRGQKVELMIIAQERKELDARITRTIVELGWTDCIKVNKKAALKRIYDM